MRNQRALFGIKYIGSNSVSTCFKNQFQEDFGRSFDFKKTIKLQSWIKNTYMLNDTLEVLAHQRYSLIHIDLSQLYLLPFQEKNQSFQASRGHMLQHKC